MIGNKHIAAGTVVATAILLGGAAVLSQPSDFQNANDIAAAETAYHDKTGK
jgi:hypothetical protein